MTIIAVYNKTVQKFQAMSRPFWMPEQWGQVIWSGSCSYFAGCKRQFTSISPIIVTGLPCIQAIWLLSILTNFPHGNCLPAWGSQALVRSVLLGALDIFVFGPEAIYTDPLAASSGFLHGQCWLYIWQADHKFTVSHHDLLSPSKLVQNLTWTLHHQWV